MKRYYHGTFVRSLVGSRRHPGEMSDADAELHCVVVLGFGLTDCFVDRVLEMEQFLTAPRAVSRHD